MCIKSEAKNGQQYQKWLFAVSELSKVEIGFISIFLLKARVLNLTISKRKNLCLPLKVEIDQFVFCLVLPECLSVKICCISPSDSEANCDGSAESPCPLFFSLSASFKNSSPREKVGKLSSLRGWWAKSLFVSIIVPKYDILPLANNGCSREKIILAKQFAHAIRMSVHYRDFEHAYVYWIWLRGSASYVIKDVLAKPGRDIVVISLLYGLCGVEFYEGEWWCFSLYFKARATIACS